MKHTTYIFSPSSLHLFGLSPFSNSLFSHASTDFSAQGTPIFQPSGLSSSLFRLYIISAFWCLLLPIDVDAHTQEQKSDLTKPVITSQVADRVTEMVNSVINIARDPRNPHNLAFNITNALANIVHIVLLAKENKSLRCKLNSGADAEQIDLELEQAVHAYLKNLDPKMKSRIVSLITQRLLID